ncbi:hypothetical protein QAD02_006441 [Eretmocerus hayati]|uniref:Uncharacterized protein n=1 Tax=Eretmocerus hayati TaxID=131215 RepID=A0ACC2N0X2_9HYME|nr:hypothetical protein QAD02_006441 [Eretmocerus hayati]
MNWAGGLLLITLLLFIDGVIAQGKEFRKINIFVVTDAGDNVANHSIATSFEHLKSDTTARVGQVYYAQINATNPKKSLENICSVWGSAVKNGTGGPGSPDVILDATTHGPTSEIAEYFATQLRVPMVSAHYERSGHLLGVRDVPDDQKDNLVRLTNPAEVLPRIVMKHCENFKIESAAILYDSVLGAGVWRNDLPKWFRLIEATEPLDEKIKILQRHKVLNIFIMGSEKTIDTVMSVATKLNLTSIAEHKWHAVTLADDYIPNCADCDSATFMLFHPHAPVNHPVVDELASKGDLRRPLIMSAFYYDMAKIVAQAMTIEVDLKMLPNTRYGHCGSYNKSSMSDEPRLRRQIYESRNLYAPTYSTFVWGDDQEGSVKFNVKGSLIQIRKSKIASKDTVETWIAGTNLPISIHNTWMAYKHQAKAKYEILINVKPPFVQNEGGEWKGYCIELLQEIRKHMNFEYTLTVVKDGKYGFSDDNGSWDGMVRELKDGRFDIALGALEVMAERDVVMDFTTPIYEDSGFLLMRRRPKTKDEPNKFYTVLAFEVWLCILAAHLFTSVLMWIFDRLSPYSYRNNKSAYPRPYDRRLFTLKECVWFCTMSLTPQGGGDTPKNLSGRLIAATWWIFGFIINASYTANLIAHNSMAKDNREKPPESLEDFSNQYKIQYAPIENSSAYYYFSRMAGIEKKYYEIWKKMSLNDSLPLYEQAQLAVWDYPVSDRFTKMFQTMQDSKFPKDMNEAKARILDERAIEFALVGDANDIRYITLRECELMRVGEEFSKRPYAIGVQEGSPLKEHLNHALYKISQERKLEAMKKKWWANVPGQKKCVSYDEAIDGIGMNSIRGLFNLSFRGIALACGVLIFEFFYYRYWTKSKPFRKIRAIEDKSFQKIKSIAFYWPALTQALNIND